jgi:hypothetical protein
MNDHLLPPDASLTYAQAWLRERLDEGACCPLCTQFAKVYRRRVNSGMARALIALYRQSQATGRNHYHLASLSRWTHEGGQLAWWGLITQRDDRRDDGGQSGWWMLTATGEQFARNEIKLPKYAHIYNGRLMKLDDSEQVSIVDALGKKFHYAELMAGS